MQSQMLISPKRNSAKKKGKEKTETEVKKKKVLRGLTWALHCSCYVLHTISLRSSLCPGF